MVRFEADDDHDVVDTTRAQRPDLKVDERGAIERRNIRAMVAKDGRMAGSLLGMNFLNTLSGFSVRGDRLILSD